MKLVIQPSDKGAAHQGFLSDFHLVLVPQVHRLLPQMIIRALKVFTKQLHTSFPTTTSAAGKEDFKEQPFLNSLIFKHTKARSSQNLLSPICYKDHCLLFVKTLMLAILDFYSWGVSFYFVIVVVCVCVCVFPFEKKNSDFQVMTTD